MKRGFVAGTSPGGPAVSAAKRKRLAALDDAAKRKQAPAAAAAAAPTPAHPTGTNSQPLRPSVPAEPSVSGPGEFPYNPLGDAVLDGALSAALAKAKAAAAAATDAVTSASASQSAPGRRTQSGAGAASRLGAAQSRAAAGVAVPGADSVAAQVLAQLVATNPRANSSDVSSLLVQRLQDRSVLLDNPTAVLKAKNMFNRRNSSYSANLRSNVRCKQTVAQSDPASKRTPSYQTMLRVHELWTQYTQSLARSSSAAGGSAAGAQALGRIVDLHGARVTVVQHSNPQHVGASGIVLRRSKTCIHLVAPDDRVRVVPLKGCCARYAVNGTTLQLSG
ncbi:hypothetical protein Agub_g1473 [Astrephomene gubernaculifera]|uniref:Uncharacterized protein n=1 Tax=Astrephomene gubernaculifera TaxID=47775 RepID=A0AAD3DFV5_9CHLO|nr:hypothetical protein Agub_g1473 [Astrephomene gubernaculifera]